MHRPWLPLLLTALVGTAWAAEAEKAEPQPGSLVSEDELDKPGKPGVPMPRALPTAPKADEETKEGEKPDKPAFVNPRAARGRKPKYALPTRITWSDGKVLEGWSWHRANAPLRIFNRKARAHEDFFFSDIKRIDIRPETQTFEPDWRWKNQGSSEKVFLEIGYFWNQYVTKIVSHEGETAEGDCSGQFYIVTVDGKSDKWYLHKRHSGRDVKHAKKEELEPLVYVKSVEFTDDFLKRIEEEKKKAEEAKEPDAKPLE